MNPLIIKVDLCCVLYRYTRTHHDKTELKSHKQQHTKTPQDLAYSQEWLRSVQDHRGHIL